MHAEENYPEPFIFNPDRFVTIDEQDHPQADPLAYAFGFGRRVCPGINLRFQMLEDTYLPFHRQGFCRSVIVIDDVWDPKKLSNFPRLRGPLFLSSR